MTITDIRFRGQSRDGFLSYVCIVIDGVFAVNGLKLVRRKGRTPSDCSPLMVCMPSRKTDDGFYIDIAHPISREFRESLERQVLDAWRNHRDSSVIASVG